MAPIQTKAPIGRSPSYISHLNIKRTLTAPKLTVISCQHNKSHMPSNQVHPINTSPTLPRATALVGIQEMKNGPSSPSCINDSQITNSTWTRLCHRHVWKEALHGELALLRNVLVCIIAAWLTNLCFSLGNIFSLKTLVHQSRESLIVATLIWTNLLFCISMVLAHTAVLLPNRFMSYPDRKPSVWFCIQKLVRGSCGYFLVALLLALAIGWLVVDIIPTRYQKFKLEFYLVPLGNHVYTAGISLVTRRVYLLETCQGQERLRAKEKAQADTAHPNSIDGKNGKATQKMAGSNHRVRGSFWRAYWQHISKIVIILFAGGYVHIVSACHLFKSELVVIIFLGCSMALKLFIQELAKWYLVWKNVHSIRTMCIVVGIPTALIDTQVRIVVLGVQSNAVLSTVGMAFVEIFMRVGKAVFVQAQIRSHQQELRRKRRRFAREFSDSSLHAMTTRFEHWKQQILALYTAEVHADMYAEYIAIGCSASILFFYGKNPKYQLQEITLNTLVSDASSSSSLSSSVGSDTANSGSAATTGWTNLSALGVQVAVEIVVDYIACVLELAMGMEFGHIRRYRHFLASIFLITAVMNIQMSSILYIS